MSPSEHQIIYLALSAALVTVVAVVAVVFIRTFRRQATVKIRVPGGPGLELAGSNDPALSRPGVSVKNAESTDGGLTATDTTGGGAEVDHVKVKKDLVVSSSAPMERNRRNPKA